MNTTAKTAMTLAMSMEFFLQIHMLDRQPRSRFFHYMRKENVLIVPAEAVDEKPNREGAEHSSHRENCYGEGPQRCESGLRDGLGIPVGPRLIVEALNDLKHQTTQWVQDIGCGTCLTASI